MVRVGLEHHPLAATAALVWSGDLPRTLQQILFDTAESITSPGLAHQVELELKKAMCLWSVVTARVELAEPSRQIGPTFPGLLTAAARGDIVVLSVLLRPAIWVPEGLN